jgi:dimethylamine monooxygenase subunit A
MTVLNATLPFAPWTDPKTHRLPGIQPLDPADWLRVADSYPGQMAERDHLIATRPQAVHALDPDALPAARELMATILPRLPALGFRIDGDRITRPDEISVPVDFDQPLLSLGRLVQEDLCLMENRGDEHVLTGAILCFPASWTLSEKFLRPLVRIHEPVASYDPDMARRVPATR